MFLNRHTLKKFVTLAKQTLNLKPRDSGPVVTFTELGDSFLITAGHDDHWLEYREVGEFDFTRCSLPWQGLQEIVDAGADDLNVTMEQEQNCVAWTDNETPVKRYYPDGPSDESPPFPEVDQWVSHDERLFPALREACQTAASNSTRYALGCLCLRGKKKDLVATDSRQLLIQHDFDWPWDEDRLIPASRCFRSAALREAAESGPIEVGRSDKHVVLRMGCWRVALPIETDARYPDIDMIVPQPEQYGTTLTIDESDRQFLTDQMPQLTRDDRRLVTIELNGSVAIRAAEPDQSSGQELILSNSSRTGPEITLESDYRFLLRAGELGFSRIALCDRDSPLLARDHRQTYLWMAYSGDPLPRRRGLKRIVSPTSQSKPPLNRKSNAMPQNNGTSSNSTSNSNGNPPDSPSIDQLIEQASTIKSNLKDLQSDLQDLITALRGQKKQAKIVRNTIDSLQKLKTLQA